MLLSMAKPVSSSVTRNHTQHRMQAPWSSKGLGHMASHFPVTPDPCHMPYQVNFTLRRGKRAKLQIEWYQQFLWLLVVSISKVLP